MSDYTGYAFKCRSCGIQFTTKEEADNHYEESHMGMHKSSRKAGFIKVANKKDLKEGTLLGTELNGNRIVLAMVGGKVYAMDAVCSHQGGPLDQGQLEGSNLACPWHHAVFDVRNGNVSETTVWAMDQKSFPVQLDESTGDILVNMSRATTTGATT